MKFDHSVKGELELRRRYYDLTFSSHLYFCFVMPLHLYIIKFYGSFYSSLADRSLCRQSNILSRCLGVHYNNINRGCICFCRNCLYKGSHHRCHLLCPAMTNKRKLLFSNIQSHAWMILLFVPITSLGSPVLRALQICR